jgi:anti-sigma factor (TIGR02949 family)
MRCQEARDLLHGYLDGELDLPGAMEIERHFEDCPECSRAYQNQRILRSAIRSNAPYFKAPASLRRSLAPKRPIPWMRPMAVAAAIALMIAATWVALRMRSGRELIAQDVVSGHVRSLMANHLTDVPSSDRHTVKPWFLGKLDFSPEVKDLAAQGFPLVGGRLDYVDGRPAGALVYQRGKHVINLFVWKSADRSEGHETLQGYNVVHWNRGGMAYWGVSDLNAGELAQFARLARDP